MSGSNLSEKDIDERVVAEANDKDAWIELKETSLEELIDACQVDTGISDLACQHDHYLYGTPKK